MKRDEREKSKTREEIQIDELNKSIPEYVDLDKILESVRYRFITEVEGKISRDMYSGDDSEMLRAMAGVLDNMSVIRALNHKRVKQCQKRREQLIELTKAKEEVAATKAGERKASVRDAMNKQLRRPATSIVDNVVEDGNTEPPAFDLDRMLRQAEDARKERNQ